MAKKKKKLNKRKEKARDWILTASTVWHWAQRCLNNFSPLAASPAGMDIVDVVVVF